MAPFFSYNSVHPSRFPGKDNLRVSSGTLLVYLLLNLGLDHHLVYCIYNQRLTSISSLSLSS